MHYRELGKTNKKVSILGLDITNLPLSNTDSSDDLIKYAIDNGVNYIDIPYKYQNIDFETYIGDFFNKNPEYKTKTSIIAKMPSWLINSKDDLDIYFENQLKNLRRESVDFYLLDYIKTDTWKKLVKYGILDFLDKIKEEGKTKYIGFSFYDELELFFEVIDSYDWDLIQVPFNFMDINNHVGFEGIRYANNENIGVMIRDPTYGGCLTNNIPSNVKEVLDFADNIKSPIEWCLNFVWDYTEIDTILFSISDLNQLKKHIKYTNNALPGCMSRNDKDIIKEVRFTYREHINVRCDQCGHCLPCDEGVNIPLNLEILNKAYMFGIIDNTDSSNYDYLKKVYEFSLTESERASNCNACGVCEKFCAQFINIPDKLEELEELFEE